MAMLLCGNALCSVILPKAHSEPSTSTPSHATHTPTVISTCTNESSANANTYPADE
ncbi:hypothetical protein CHAD_05040 [Corynebacterium hadale]|nr:hypothetical protein CHAD_05040 [Corynebacterium hadale]